MAELVIPVDRRCKTVISAGRCKIYKAALGSIPRGITMFTSKFKGLPLIVWEKLPDGWGGRSNFASCNSDAKVQLNSLEECFEWIEKWDSTTYYIFDGQTQDVYYSCREAKEHAKLVLPLHTVSPDTVLNFIKVV